MGQLIDLVYYDTIAFGDFTSGVYFDGLELGTLPLKIRVKSVTLIIEAETAMTKAMNGCLMVTTEEANSKYVREDALIIQLDDFIQSNDTGTMALIPDNMVYLFNIMYGANDDEWIINTQDCDIILEMDSNPLRLYHRHQSYDGSAQAAGSMDVFIILECEVL